MMRISLVKISLVFKILAGAAGRVAQYSIYFVCVITLLIRHSLRGRMCKELLFLTIILMLYSLFTLLEKQGSCSIVVYPLLYFAHVGYLALTI